MVHLVVLVMSVAEQLVLLLEVLLLQLLLVHVAPRPLHLWRCLCLGRLLWSIL